MADKIFYEPHPITAERKAELKAQGYRIIDARFKPGNWEKRPEVKAELAQVAKRGRPKKADKVEEVVEVETVAPDVELGDNVAIEPEVSED